MYVLFKIIKNVWMVSFCVEHKLFVSINLGTAHMYMFMHGSELSWCDVHLIILHLHICTYNVHMRRFNQSRVYENIHKHNNKWINNNNNKKKTINL